MKFKTITENRGLIPYVALKALETGSFAKATELGFWKKKLTVENRDYSQSYHEKEMAFALADVKANFGATGNKVKVLDVGSGPRSRMTRGFDAGLFDLAAVDPLADYYKREFEGRGFLMAGKAEELSKLFFDGTFHIVYASNSLDHGESPMLGVANMMRVARPGGIVAVCGNEREGSRAHWEGMHQHNLWVENDTLMWERKGESPRPILGGEGCKTIFLDKYSYVDFDGTVVKYFFAMWRKPI